jgi:hypothetical protein
MDIESNQEQINQYAFAVRNAAAPLADNPSITRPEADNAIFMDENKKAFGEKANQNTTLHAEITKLSDRLIEIALELSKADNASAQNSW